MQTLFEQYLALILIIVFLVMLAQKMRIAYPILLVVAGLLFSMIPGAPVLEVDPELIFIIFLPPLLFEAAWYTSWKQFWKYRRIISSFAFLLVIITSFVVAVASTWLIPGFTLTLGFLLGGIVSPPDAVSASTVLKYVRVPKSLSVIIEGESLMNDASSLVIFNFAIAAVLTGQFILADAAIDFVKMISLGILTGVAIAYLYFRLHKWLPTTVNVDIVLTITAPYVMYITAESFHFSGVLSVVSGGLFLSNRSHLFLSFRSRLQGANVWSTLAFVLNGIVFMLIGLQLPTIASQLGEVRISQAIWYGVAITGVLIVSRIISAMFTSAFTRFISRFIKTAESNPGWRIPLVLGWAGMRGVVSLAAALSIPLLLRNGSAFPQRNLILFITFIVILLTLVVQGLTLPWLIKWLKIGDDANSEGALDQEKNLRRELAVSCINLLNQDHAEDLKTNRSLQELKARYETDQLMNEDGHRKEQKEFRKIYLQLINLQREVLLVRNKDTEMDEDIIRKYQELLDLEEAKLQSKYNM